MITPDKKTKKKNILTAIAILVFMVFLFLFTLVSNLTLTTLSRTIFGAFLDICVVPPKPVTLQNKSYKGTAANDKPNIRTKIPASNIGVNVLPLIISVYQTLQHYKE